MGVGWVKGGEVEEQEGEETGISMLNKIVLKIYLKITKKKGNAWGGKSPIPTGELPASHAGG